ncbi:MAG: DUF2891 domain-containing protein [Nitriliruptor sp.]|nr:MAG: DUF2891 domain-containing protein [Nitriliruptor sp.]
MTDTLPSTAASRFVRVGLDNVAREYPNHPGHLLTGPDDLRPPRALHPVFFGSYDWHSSVHQHWMLVRLLHRYPDLPEADAIHAWFDATWTPANLEVERAYVTDPARATFERPYGWAWLVLLHATLHHLAVDPAADPRHAGAAARWATNLLPLQTQLAERAAAWLSTTRLPNRVGAHPNSAFACALLLDAAAMDPAAAGLAPAVHGTARRWYLDDRDAPVRFEPSSADFLSPSLVEAALLSRVLEPGHYARWLDRFLPDPTPLTLPVEVEDRTDPQTVHLDGLNLSRAWCWLQVAAPLPDDDPRRPLARATARTHRDTSLPHVLDDYVGSHWLPSFVVHLADVEVATTDAAR